MADERSAETEAENRGIGVVYSELQIVELSGIELFHQDGFSRPDIQTSCILIAPDFSPGDGCSNKKSSGLQPNSQISGLIRQRDWAEALIYFSLSINPRLKPGATEERESR
ncbi:MAG: hypothetical protein JW764_06280 [Chlorobiaceae bacterium]|nr:hypothetical protein [Chlorobiaceae bacterium]